MTDLTLLQSSGRCVPPPILTSEPGSFARWTFECRIPRIIDEVISTNNYPREILDDLHSLRLEVTTSSIQPLTEQAADKRYWNLVANPFLGNSWLDVPSYLAEAYFYRRLLEVVRYFQPGEWQRRDAFGVTKCGELREDVGLSKTKDALRRVHGLSPSELLRYIIYASLWGNRADLSNKEVAVLSRDRSSLEIEQDHLLIDDVPLALQLLQSEGLS